MSNKREDLQGIRGLAILSVLLFHFFPKLFPNGYVGVDQFFILSGFLMAKILFKETAISISGTLFFYYRRMKRILPLYALFIFLTLIFSLLFFEKTVFDFNIIHAIRSLLFISNTQTEDNDLDYERFLANAEILFTHTWSLSAEVQFYVIAPFMILISLYMSTSLFFAIILAIGFLSLAAFTVLIEDEETNSFAFNSMVTRLWQFSLGIICCHMTKNISDYEKLEQIIEKASLIEPQASGQDEVLDLGYRGCLQEKAFINTIDLPFYLFILLSTAAAFSTYAISQLVLRLTVCFSTTFLIYLGHEHTNRLLSLKPLVYFGDISYSLYLVHWPIYLYVKQNYENNLVALFAGIVVAIMLAVLSTEVYEKFYLQQSIKFIFSLCFILYILNFGLLFHMRPESVTIETFDDPDVYWKKPQNLTNEQIHKLNIQLNAADFSQVRKIEADCNLIKKIRGTKYCKFNNTDFTGNSQIMLIGNSFVRNMAPMFLNEKNCRKKAKDIYMYSPSTCEVLEDSVRHWSNCWNFNAAHIDAVNLTRPDYLFILTRHFASMYASNTTVDPILKEELKHIAILEKMVSKKIFIFDAIPRTDVRSVKWKKLLNEVVRDNTTLPTNAELLDKTANYEIARKRTRQVIEKCSKCELIDVMPIFMKNNIFQHYDEDNKLIHFAMSLHFTKYAMSKFSPMFSQICERL